MFRKRLLPLAQFFSAMTYLKKKHNNMLSLLDAIPQPAIFPFLRLSVNVIMWYKKTICLLVIVYVLTFSSKKQTLKQKTDLF